MKKQHSVYNDNEDIIDYKSITDETKPLLQTILNINFKSKLDLDSRGNILANEDDYMTSVD